MAKLIQEMHPEDVKAAIRKQFGSVKAFVEAKGLPPTSVSDIFRGRTSARVSDEIEEVLQGQFSKRLDDSSTADARKAVSA